VSVSGWKPHQVKDGVDRSYTTVMSVYNSCVSIVCENCFPDNVVLVLADSQNLPYAVHLA